MPRILDGMPEPDRPVTRRELREELDAVLQTLATKDDLKAFATKEDLKAFATKGDLKGFATKQELEDTFKTFADDIKGHFAAVTEHFKSEFFEQAARLDRGSRGRPDYAGRRNRAGSRCASYRTGNTRHRRRGRTPVETP